METDALAKTVKRNTRVTALWFIIGLLVGWLLIGWWLWPVKWLNVAPSQLAPTHQQAYIEAVAESYRASADIDVARARLAAWEQDDLVVMLSIMERQAKTAEAQQSILVLREALALTGSDSSILSIILEQQFVWISAVAALALIVAALGLWLWPAIERRQIAQAQQKQIRMAEEAAIVDALASAPPAEIEQERVPEEPTVGPGPQQEASPPAVAQPAPQPQQPQPVQNYQPQPAPIQAGGGNQPPQTEEEEDPAPQQPPPPRPPVLQDDELETDTNQPQPSTEEPDRSEQNRQAMVEGVEAQAALSNLLAEEEDEVDEDIQDILNSVFDEDEELNQLSILLKDQKDIDIHQLHDHVNQVLEKVRMRNESIHNPNGLRRLNKPR